MTTKIIIVDDEDKAVKSLKWELENFSKDVDILATFTVAKEAVNYLREHNIDAVFLDVEMPEISGFDFLKFFPSRDFAVIFTTAYDHYAIKAIKENALDYLLKPVDSDELNLIIDKIKKHRLQQQKDDALEQTLLKGTPNKIKLNANGKLLFFEASDLIYCESDGNYTTVFLINNKKILLTKKLKEVHAMLPKQNFLRVHNSFVINIDKIKEYQKNESYIVLSNDKHIPVSRSKRSFFLDNI